MNRKSLFRSAALVAALAAGLAAPLANALTVVPAAYVTGVVTAIDAAKGTVTVNGVAYNAAPNLLTGIVTGSQIDVTFLRSDGKLTAMAIETTDADGDDRMAE